MSSRVQPPQQVCLQARPPPSRRLRQRLLPVHGSSRGSGFVSKCVDARRSISDRTPLNMYSSAGQFGGSEAWSTRQSAGASDHCKPDPID